jgi:PIN domain nuclease of toxin-antitoxin system
MIPSAVLDTHTAIWYLNADARLSERAKQFIEEAGRRGMPVLISSISLVEVVYLCEKGRIPSESLTRLLEEELSLQDNAVCVADLTIAVALAVGRVIRDEVPEMPDRIIAVTALYFGVPVISRDRKIRISAVETIW